MGYYGKIEEKIKARELRKQGLSYSEILKIIPVSKNSISRWCRNIPLTQNQLKKLYESKQSGLLKGAIIGAKKQQEERIIQTKQLFQAGMKDTAILSTREKFIAGVVLYAAEGTKRDGKWEFTNTDPYLIKFMIEWLKQFCSITLNKLRGAIWIHEELDEKKAKCFWANLTNIPQEQFHKSYIAKNKPNSKKIRKKIHEYGVFSIRYSDVKLHRKMMGWIAGVLKNSWYNNKTDFPCSSMVEQEAVKRQPFEVI